MAPTRVDMLRTFIEQKPEDPFPRYALAQELRNGGDLTGAWEIFEALIRDFASYVPAYFHAGETLRELERFEEARSVLETGAGVALAAGDLKTKSEIETALAALPAR